MSESVKVIYKVGEEESAFVLDSRKTWKGKLVRGYDVAEMIAHDIWSNPKSGSKYPSFVDIVSPASFAGTYEIVATWEPTFSAKRVDNAA